MKRIITFTLALLMLLPAAATALEPEQPFLPFYWVKGKVTNPDNSPSENRIVIFYIEGSPEKVRATTDSNGNYALNVYDLAYYYGKAIAIHNAIYKIAVCRGPGGLGKDPTDITLAVNKGYFEHDITLAVNEGPVETAITILSPAGGENWQIGSEHEIEWQTINPITNIKVEYSVDNGVNYSNVALVNNRNSYSWTVPSPAAGQAKIKLTDANNPAVFAESQPFGISGFAQRGGPQLDITLLLEGYYDAGSNKQKYSPIEVELRQGDNVITSVPFYLLQDNNTRALDGVGVNVQDGAYKVVIRHLNHLSVITKNTLTLALNSPATTLDLSGDAENEDQPQNANTSAMKLIAGKRLMRGGEYKTDGLITIDDWDKWKDAYGSDPNKQNWNPQADGNGDGKVTVDDWQIWKDNYGSRTYVP